MSVWLVSRRFDLSMFLLPAALGLALVPFQPLLAADGDTPLPLSIALVLLVDVAHVWATLYRSYFDPSELRRHPLRYALVPFLAYVGGLFFASVSTAVFWTGLAYLAVFHFVRQQYGWVRLYHQRDPGLHRFDRLLDVATVYASTLVPLLWWHAHLPRRFVWFVPGDFIAGWMPPGLAEGLLYAYLGLLAAFLARQLSRRPLPIGKLSVVLGTALCWSVGIVLTNSDYAFTVTNILIHGVPYFGFVWLYGQKEPHPPGSFLDRLYRHRAVGLFLGILVALAYLEELGWDRIFWHSGPPYFGPSVDPGPGATAFLLPLLALPQATHYLLDAFLWRRADLSARRAPG